MDEMKYLRVFKIAKIPPNIGSKICSCLTEQTLERLTKVGMERALIKPILEKAENMQGGINDENVNSILNDVNLITSMMAVYCKRY